MTTFDQALALHQSGDLRAAEAAYRAVLAKTPRHPEALSLLGVALSMRGAHAEALQTIRRAIALDPKTPLWRTHLVDALLRHAMAAHESGAFSTMQAAAEEATRLAPRNHEAWFLLGRAHCAQGREDLGLAPYERARATAPPDAPNVDRILSNLAQTLEGLGRLEDALPHYDQAVAMAPTDPRHAYHRALARMGMGARDAAGFDARFSAVPMLVRVAHPTATAWNPADGLSSLHGKTMLIVDEQGFGDSIMMARYLPTLAAHAARVVFACRPALRPLYALQPWVRDGRVTLANHADAASTPCDVHASMMDMLCVNDAPVTEAPYLFVDSAAPLPDAHHGRAVGILWRGNARHVHGHRRSIAAATVAPLCATPRARFFSFLLPHDATENDQAVRTHAAVTDEAARAIESFADTARWLAAMDLVITVDTALAHLAGALGRSTWVLLPLGNDWRWLKNRDDTPLYPTVRLFRQTTYRDWDTVIDSVRQALEDHA